MKSRKENGNDRPSNIGDSFHSHQSSSIPPSRSSSSSTESSTALVGADRPKAVSRSRVSTKELSRVISSSQEKAPTNGNLSARYEILLQDEHPKKLTVSPTSIANLPVGKLKDEGFCWRCSNGERMLSEKRQRIQRHGQYLLSSLTAIPSSKRATDDRDSGLDVATQTSRKVSAKLSPAKRKLCDGNSTIPPRTRIRRFTASLDPSRAVE